MTAPPVPTVLVVDDEAANRKLLTEIVGRLGCRTVVASGGAEALSIIERESVDLVLLDLMMPEVDGMAVLRSLGKRNLLSSMPVVVVTTHEDRAVRREALLAGAIDFLTKPIDSLELGCKVRSLTELKRLRMEAAERAAQQASVSMLNRIHEAVAGLPIVVYEVQLGHVQGLEGSWRIGDALRVIGISDEAFLAGGAWLDQVHPDDRDDAERHLSRALDGTQRQFAHRMRLLVNGVYGWRHNVASFDPVRGSVVGALLDIDEYKLVEEQLLQSQKMEAVGTLAGGIAHDFNNLLTAILGYAGFVQEGLPPGDPLRDDIAQVLKGGERAAGLTRQLLTFSRKQPEQKVPVDLNTRLEQLTKLLTRTVGEHIELTLLPSPHPAVVRMDPIQFDQVGLNLAVNARDAMLGGGKLRIALESADPRDRASGGQARVRLSVTDTGTGMDEATKARIFEPFFTTKEKGKGTGLGLAVCFAIVADAGGVIEVESAPGRGTTFRIDFPRCDAPPVQEKTTTYVHENGKNACVLVVEDDAMVRGVAVSALERAGYRVHTAGDGPDALRKLDSLGRELQVLFTDVVMPGCSGYEVVKHARQVAPEAAILLTSGYADESIRQEDLSGLPVLWKPLRSADLLRAVGEAIRAKRSSKAK